MSRSSPRLTDKMLEKERHRTTGDCPQGYKLTPGDIPGWGDSIKPGGYLNQNMGQCKDLCNANNLCCSFEWSPTERRCNLNQECVPTEGKYKDYLFCHKREVKF